MLSGVFRVKKSISDDIMSIWFHRGHYSEQETQMDYIVLIRIVTSIKTKWLWSVTDISATFLPVPISYIIVIHFVAI